MNRINSNKTPIYKDTGFNLKNIKLTKAAFKEEIEHLHQPTNYIYSRYRNPTVVAVEKQLREIEQSEWALLAQSGMAVIDIALSIFQHAEQKRPWLFFSDIYGGTNSFIDEILIKRRGIKIERFNSRNNSYDISELIQLMDKIHPELLYLETVSNPMLIVADIKQIILEAKKREIIVLIDNTFASPYLVKPLALGADLVIHSATKYLSGHGNIMAGVLCGNSLKLMQKAIEYRKYCGHLISPDEAYNLGSQLKTFKLRFRQQIENADKLAHFLSEQKQIEKVFYPGLTEHPTHHEAENIFSHNGFGAMITFQFAGIQNNERIEASNKFYQKIDKNIELIPSLGDVETIYLPVDAVWGDKYPFPGTIRLSVGIEDFNYLKNIFEQALI